MAGGQVWDANDARLLLKTGVNAVMGMVVSAYSPAYSTYMLSFCEGSNRRYYTPGGPMVRTPVSIAGHIALVESLRATYERG